MKVYLYFRNSFSEHLLLMKLLPVVKVLSLTMETYGANKIKLFILCIIYTECVFEDMSFSCYCCIVFIGSTYVKPT